MQWYSKELIGMAKRVLGLREEPPQPSIFEQQKEVIDSAEEWDRLTTFPAWTKALRSMAEEVNATLVEATKHEQDPAQMMWQVTRWNAKRQLLDNLQAQIEATMRERDRIVAEYKEMQDVNASESDTRN